MRLQSYGGAGDAFGLHVFIRPLGVRAILGVASAEISSLVLNLSEIWGDRAGDLIEMLVAANSWRQRFAILDRAFVLKLRPTSAQPEIAWAWRRLEKTHGSVPIQQLADEICWSRFHFSGRFRDAIGITPKSAARVFRFERACRLIMDQRPSLAHVAISCGYLDQVHEIGGCDNESDDSKSVHQSLV